jgi:hypothetical protein
LTELNRQEEKISQIHDTIEANLCLIDESATTLRNLTWGGFIYNSCVQTFRTIRAAPFPGANPEKKDTLSISQLNKFEAPLNFASTDEKSPSFEESRPVVSVNNDEEERILLNISSAVAELEEIGLKIGKHLDGENKSLDELVHLADHACDETLAVTLRSEQLLSSKVKTRNAQVLLGKYQFIDSVEGRFLAVDGDLLILKNTPDKSTFFNCVASKDGNRSIFGIQSDKTHKFIGCDMWGGISCSAAYFGTQEVFAPTGLEL